MSGIFDEHVGLGAVLDIVVLLGGLGGGWATMKVIQKVTLEKLAELKGDVDEDRQRQDQRHEANIDRFGKLELKIEADCLKKSDFSEFERRFDKRVDKIEHAAANAAAKAAGMIGDLLRSQGRLRDGNR